MLKDAVSHVKALKKRHLLGASLFFILFFVLFQINYIRNTAEHAVIATEEEGSLADGQRRFLVVITTEAQYAARRSILRSAYFNIDDNLIPAADFDKVEYAFLVHGGPPKSNSPERRAFETEKMEYNDIYTLPAGQAFTSSGTAFHWINATAWSKPFDYVVIQDIHTFVHLDRVVRDLNSAAATPAAVDQMGSDGEGMVVSWSRLQQLLSAPAADGSAASNVVAVWENSVESTNTDNLIVTHVYQDQDFLDLGSLYQLQPVLPKSTAKSIAVVTSSYIYDYCMEPSGTRASLNKRSYADKHGYAFVARSREFAQQALRPDQRRTVWGKIDVIQKVLPKYDWVFWLDMDAVVMNSEQTVQDLLQRRLEIDDSTHFVIVRPGTDKMINAGVFLIRNTAWSFKFLQEIQSQSEWYRQGPSYEQGAMWDVMRREGFIQHTKFLDRENHLFNTFPKFYQQDDFIVHFAPDKCPNSATLKGLAAADSIKKGHAKAHILFRSEPYDPYIPNNQRGADAAGGAGNQKTARVQQQVDEVVGIMQENIDKVMQRGERLDDLRGKTEDLQATAGHFRRGANQVRKRMWWKDLKWKIIIAVTILVILGVIIGSIVGTQTKNNNSSPQPAPTQPAATSPSA
ncbi:hypothetical protein MBANPS3_008414 [Mucor bainieri]